MTLSLCLEMLFRDLPFTERLRRAARLGYRAIEFWDWRDKDLSEVTREAVGQGLTVAAISGNRKHALVDPCARTGLVEEMKQVLDVAGRLNCRHLMMLSDVLQPDGSAAPVPPAAARVKVASIVDGLRELAPLAESANITLLLEPLNTVLDHRGCFLDSSDVGVEVVRRVNSARVKLLYDIYHMSMMGEDALEELPKKLEWIGYLHVADMPGRHEPGTGRLNYGAVNGRLRQLGYRGFLGMEFSALASDEDAARAALRLFAAA